MLPLSCPSSPPVAIHDLAALGTIVYLDIKIIAEIS
jgi:hypothetical protein